jgi:hypothetical protein
MPNAAHRLPQDLSAVKRRLRGLDPDGVRRVFQRQRAQREDVEHRLQELEASHAAQRAELDALRERERLIPATLARAQQAADEILDKARQDADRCLADADADVQRRLAGAEQQLAQLTEVAHTLAADLVERADAARQAMVDARRSFTAVPSEPPPAPPLPTSAVPTDLGPTAPDTTPADLEEVAIRPDDLAPEGQRTIRVRLAPVGSPAEVAAAERRLHGLAAVRTVRLEELAGDRATLLVGVDAEQLDVAPLLEAGAELIGADQDLLELRLAADWAGADQPSR